jgi:Tol biopolymer transport system component
VIDSTIDSANQDAPDESDRLDSWKEIAGYLKRDVTTVRRWEKREGLPVHRHLHERRDSVYAFKSELDRWWEGRTAALSGNGNGLAALAPQERTRGSRLPPVTALVAALTVLLALTLATLVSRKGTVERDTATVRFALLPPDASSFISVIAVAPDARAIAFTARPKSQPNAEPLLWIRPLDSVEAYALHDTDGAMFPFWSPDSRQVGFFAGGRLWVVDAVGGSPQPIAEAPVGRGGTWSREGVIVFAPGDHAALLRVSAAGGATSPVTALREADAHGHLWPEFLPDGRHFLFFAHGDQNSSEHHNLFVGALDGSMFRHLFSVDSHVSFADGHLIYLRDRKLVAQQFDTRRLTVVGDPIEIVDRVHQQEDLVHKADFAVAPGGVLAYRRMQSPASRLMWSNRQGLRTPLTTTPAEYYDPTFSPDDRRVALAVFDPDPSPRFGFGIVHVRSDVWLIDRISGVASQVTTDPAIDWGPVWAPEGNRLVFSSNRRDGRVELFLKDVSRDGETEVPLATHGTNPVAQSWSPDGQYLVYLAFDPKTRGDLWLLPMSGERTPRPFLQTPHSEQQAQISPDGRWVAYASNASGREEVWVQRFPTPSTPIQVSSTGGGDPRWRRDGRELFYVATDRQLMALPVTPGEPFVHGVATPLFDARIKPHWYNARNVFDVSRDGRLLVMAPLEDDRDALFTVVLNWRPEATNGSALRGFGPASAVTRQVVSAGARVHLASATPASAKSPEQ